MVSGWAPVGNIVFAPRRRINPQGEQEDSGSQHGNKDRRFLKEGNEGNEGNEGPSDLSTPSIDNLRLLRFLL